MQVLVNSDRQTAGAEKLSDWIRTVVEEDLGHFSGRITRVEVHLADENSTKQGSRDKRCMMEARIKGHEPVAVTETSDNLDLAIRGAARKLHTAVGHLLDRLE